MYESLGVSVVGRIVLYTVKHESVTVYIASRRLSLTTGAGFLFNIDAL